MPRPASTIVLLREGDAEPEALLLRRHGRSGFAAGAWVFPGGTVDEGDRAAARALLSRAEAERVARRLSLGDADEAGAYLVAACREAFEETAILLLAGAEADGGRRAGWRAELLAERLDFASVAERAGGTLEPGQIVYLARWITPEAEPRRYDTRFFLGAVAAGTEARPHLAELVEERWIAPGRAVEMFARGELAMLPPTVHTLRRLGSFGSAGEALEAMRERPVPPLMPTMRQAEEGVEIVLPGAALEELDSP